MTERTEHGGAGTEDTRALGGGMCEWKGRMVCGRLGNERPVVGKREDVVPL